MRMIHRACVATAVVMLVGASVAPALAQYAEAEAAGKEVCKLSGQQIQLMRQVRDVASARRVAAEAKRNRDRMEELADAMKNPQLSADEKKKLEEKYVSKLRSDMEKIKQEALRISALPDAAEINAVISSGGSAQTGGSSSGRTPPEKGTWAFLFPLLMLVIMVACVGMLYTEGMWSNAVRLVNVIFAALLATNYWEPAARYMQDMAPTFTYYWDFLCLWGLFGIFTVIFRALTDTISRVKVRFLKLADQIGSTIFSLWIGYVMVCFTMFTLNTAPLSENFMFGAFRSGQSNFYLGLTPDLQWAGFTQKMSMGPFARGLSEGEAAEYGTSDSPAEAELAVFDRNGSFVPKYAARRLALEKYVDTKKTSRVDEADVRKR